MLFMFWGNIIGLQSYMLLCFNGSRKPAECNFLLKYNINLNNIFIKMHFFKLYISIVEVILYNIINIKVTILGTMIWVQNYFDNFYKKILTQTIS